MESETKSARTNGAEVVSPRREPWVGFTKRTQPQRGSTHQSVSAFQAGDPFKSQSQGSRPGLATFAPLVLSGFTAGSTLNRTGDDCTVICPIFRTTLELAITSRIPMNTYRTILFIALFAGPLFHGLAARPDPKAMTQEITRRGVRVALASLPSKPATELSGHYSSRGSEEEGGVGALTGDDIYLFPDGRYLYLQWGCVLEPTIYDKGRWIYENGFVELRTDGSLPRSARPRDATYLPLLSPSRTKRIRLMGSRFDYRYFRENAGPRAEFMLLLCSKTRVERITPKAAASLYQQLFKSGWRPEFFSTSRRRSPNPQRHP